MKKVLVISLGGSLIVPEKVNSEYLVQFVKTLRKHFARCKFVIVCGGGLIARRYISALRAEGKPQRELATAGIRATRMNAEFVMQLFGKNANGILPRNMKDIKGALPKNNVVVCGALRYAPHSTSDGTAAKIADFLHSDFLNMTDVNGLYTDNPKTNPRAKFIKQVSWKGFEKRALNLDFKAGQHFVLDQEAAKLIRKHNVKTFIVGPNLKNLSYLISGKNFIGTIIGG